MTRDPVCTTDRPRPTASEHRSQPRACAPHERVAGAVLRAMALSAVPAHGALIDGTLGSGTKTGYTFTVTRDEAAPTLRWVATADPVEVDEGFERRFWMNQAGTTFYAKADAVPPASLDPTAGPPSGWVSLR
jgi:hypothetical protein